MEFQLEQELERLTNLAMGKMVKTRRIPVSDIVISNWVRFKCRYGCKVYAKHFGCPPYAPSPHETRAMVNEYKTGLLLRFFGMVVEGSDQY